MTRIGEAQELKALQTRKAKLEAALRTLLNDSNDARNKYENEKGKLKIVNSSIESITKQSKSLIISEHSMLRFIEHHFNISMSEIQDMMMPESKKKAAKFMGSGKLEIGDRLFAIIKNNTVVTCINEKELTK